MKEYYNNNESFKNYIDKYCQNRKCTVEESMDHAIVKEVYNYYIK